MIGWKRKWCTVNREFCEDGEVVRWRAIGHREGRCKGRIGRGDHTWVEVEVGVEVVPVPLSSYVHYHVDSSCHTIRLALKKTIIQNRCTQSTKNLCKVMATEFPVKFRRESTGT